MFPKGGNGAHEKVKGVAGLVVSFEGSSYAAAKSFEDFIVEVGMTTMVSALVDGMMVRTTPLLAVLLGMF
jgi:hypothetical protein